MKQNNKNTEVTILLNGKPFEVPPGGSLGILALGSVGVKAWKKAKKEWEKKQRKDDQA